MRRISSLSYTPLNADDNNLEGGTVLFNIQRISREVTEQRGIDVNHRMA